MGHSNKMAEGGGDNNGTGLSRAAKKRAKKKKQQQQQQQHQQQQQQQHSKETKCHVRVMAPTGSDREVVSSISLKRKRKDSSCVEARPTSLSTSSIREGSQQHDLNAKQSTFTKTLQTSNHDCDEDYSNEDDDQSDKDSIVPIQSGEVECTNVDLQDLPANLWNIVFPSDDSTIAQVEQQQASKKACSPNPVAACRKNTKEQTMTDHNSDCRKTNSTMPTTPPGSNIESYVDTPTSRERARMALQFLMAPSGISLETFYQDYWETKPLCVQFQQKNDQSDTTSNENDGLRRYRHRLDGFLSREAIRNMVQQHTLYYGRDLNVTRYGDTSADGIKRRITLDPVVSTSKVTTNHHYANQPNPTAADAANTDQPPLDSFVPVDASQLWKLHDQEGCTIRLLCPHKYNAPVHSLLSLIELEWGCMVGANAYLTPAVVQTSTTRSTKSQPPLQQPQQKQQGFAPHYDDIEAFCLQLQGRKRWKVYSPLQEDDTLPRTSSRDFTDHDLRHVQPVLDVILEPGDVLYMPRGWIHQAYTIQSSTLDHDKKADTEAAEKVDDFSLHLTVSTYQQWAWVDFLEILMPDALQAATARGIPSINGSTFPLREGLPRQFLDYMGVMHDNRAENDPEPLKQFAKTCGMDTKINEVARIERLQENFRVVAKKQIMRVAKEAINMVDTACDEIGKRFLSDRLPPKLTSQEAAETSQGQDGLKIMPNMLCRLVRPGIARLVLEEGKAVLYHCVDNTCMYHERALSPMDFEMDDGPAIEQLLTTIEPHWIAIGDLIHDTVEDKVGVAQALFDEGILAVREEK